MSQTRKIVIKLAGQKGQTYHIDPTSIRAVEESDDPKWNFITLHIRERAQSLLLRRVLVAATRAELLSLGVAA